MSSRELVDELFGLVTEIDDDGQEWLVSAEFLPQRSAFNTALRGGDWSLEEYREARLVNELAALRADERGYSPDLLQSPAQIAAEEEHERWQKQRHDDNLAQMRGEGR